MDSQNAVTALVREVERQKRQWPPFNSLHEGYAVALEEMDELWEAIKRQPRIRDNVKGEAIHAGAVILRFLIELCEP